MEFIASLAWIGIVIVEFLKPDKSVLEWLVISICMLNGIVYFVIGWRKANRNRKYVDKGDLKQNC